MSLTSFGQALGGMVEEAPPVVFQETAQTQYGFADIPPEKMQELQARLLEKDKLELVHTNDELKTLSEQQEKTRSEAPLSSREQTAKLIWNEAPDNQQETTFTGQKVGQQTDALGNKIDHVDAAGQKVTAADARDPTSQEAIIDAKMARLDTLSRAAPQDPLGDEIAKNVNHMKVGNPHADVLQLNNTLEAVATMEGTVGVVGQVRGDPGADLKKIDKGLDAQLSGLNLRGLNLLGEVTHVGNDENVQVSQLSGQAFLNAQEAQRNSRATEQQDMGHVLALNHTANG